jgi:hypothetical protein
VGVLVGAVLGAAAFHTTGRLRRTVVEPEEVETVSYSAFHSTNGSTPFQTLVPVRIHYRGEPGLNRRDPVLPPDCPIPIGPSPSSSPASAAFR